METAAYIRRHVMSRHHHNNSKDLKHLLCAKYCSKISKFISSFNPHSNSMK